MAACCDSSDEGILHDRTIPSVTPAAARDRQGAMVKVVGAARRADGTKELKSPWSEKAVAAYQIHVYEWYWYDNHDQGVSYWERRARLVATLEQNAAFDVVDSSGKICIEEGPPRPTLPFAGKASDFEFAIDSPKGGAFHMYAVGWNALTKPQQETIRKAYSAQTGRRQLLLYTEPQKHLAGHDWRETKAQSEVVASKCLVRKNSFPIKVGGIKLGEMDCTTTKSYQHFTIVEKLIEFDANVAAVGIPARDGDVLKLQPVKRHELALGGMPFGLMAQLLQFVAASFSCIMARTHQAFPNHVDQ